MKHLALVGPTGIGKTYNLFNILKYKVPGVLLVRSLEDLWKFDSKFTDIIFDDLSFEKSRPELLIHLTDSDFPCPIRILRKSVEISSKVRKWFTHNNISAYEPILATIEQQQAINRRLEVLEVTSREEIITVIEKRLNEACSKDN